MNTKAISAGFLIAAIVIFSGCLGGGSSSSAGSFPGIKITDFRSEFTEIDAGEDSMISLTFDNRGDYNAGGVSATLIRKGAFSDSDDFESYADIGEGAVVDKPLNNVFSGDEFYWYLLAPAVNQDRLEEVQARLGYNYQTEAYSTLNFVPQLMLREKGKEAFPMYPYSSNSPVSIGVETNQPIVIRPGDESQRVRINLVFTNTGGGRVNSASMPPSTFQCTKEEGCIDEVKIDTLGDSCKIIADVGSTQFQCCAKEGHYFIKASDTGCLIGEDGENNEGWGYTSICGEISCGTICKENGFSVSSVDGTECICTKGDSVQYQKILKGIKLIQDNQGRYTLSDNFALANSEAATSCQFHITAKYRYEIDSEVLPITVMAIEQ